VDQERELARKEAAERKRARVEERRQRREEARKKNVGDKK
jgi:hypothetical protein